MLFCSISGEGRVNKGRFSTRMKEDKDKEVKCLNFPFCNRKTSGTIEIQMFRSLYKYAF
jgi:hypothetical protein